MQSNKNTKGLPVPSEQERIKDRNLKVFTYLLCMSQLADNPLYGSPRRIFQQKDINLAKMGRILKMDERTIKKYWEELEKQRLIIFNDKGSRWEEDKTKSFVDRWKERRKHGETYYHIPISESQLFRKIPRETLIDLNENYQVSELSLKIYIILTNFQELCIINHKTERAFTYQDLQKVLGYGMSSNVDRRLERSLLELTSLGLIEIRTSSKILENGWKVPVFILKQVNWYVDFDFKDFTTVTETWDEKTIEEVRNMFRQQYITNNKERGA